MALLCMLTIAVPVGMMKWGNNVHVSVLNPKSPFEKRNRSSTCEHVLCIRGHVSIHIGLPETLWTITALLPTGSTEKVTCPKSLENQDWNHLVPEIFILTAIVILKVLKEPQCPRAISQSKIGMTRKKQKAEGREDWTEVWDASLSPLL